MVRAASYGNLTLAKRMDNRLITLGLTRFVTDSAGLAATLKRHGLPEAWAADRDSTAWAPAPHRGPSFEEFAERLRAFDATPRRRKPSGTGSGAVSNSRREYADNLRLPNQPNLEFALCKGSYMVL